MKANNLKELRELRNQEKAIKARIDEISGKATEEAVAILAKKGLEKSKDIITAKTGSLSSKTKKYNEEEELIIEQEVESMMEATPAFEKDALSRISEFKNEGKRKKMSNIIKRKLKRSNE